MNPQHCIPTLDDNELVLWESRVILTYLASMYGKDDSLYPKDVRIRALVDQRLHFDLGTLYQRTFDYFVRTAQGFFMSLGKGNYISPFEFPFQFPTMRLGAPLDETKKARLEEALGWLETIMKNRTWAAAEQFTVADLSLCVTVSQIESFGFDLKPYPKTRIWLEKCKEELEPFGYQEINQSGADMLGGMFREKLS